MSSILALSDTRSYHLYRKETDMRKSFDALCGIILNELGKQVIQGDSFIFINRARIIIYNQVIRSHSGIVGKVCDQVRAVQCMLI